METKKYSADLFLGFPCNCKEVYVKRPEEGVNVSLRCEHLTILVTLANPNPKGLVCATMYGTGKSRFVRVGS